MSIDQAELRPHPDAASPKRDFAGMAERFIRDGRWRSVWLLTALILTAVALLDPANWPGIVAVAARAFAGTLPYILFAVTLIAWLKAAGAESAIARAFEGREVRMIVLASLFGGLAPFCSCEVVPFVAGLLAVGAPLSAIMAFWLSSPLIDPPTLLITAGALGWDFAIAKAVGAVALGLMGGFAMLAITRTGAFADPARANLPTRGCGCGPSPMSGKPVWRFWQEAERRGEFRTEWVANALFLAKWLAFAYVLEALLIRYVPAELIASAVGGEGLLPIAIGAVIGAPAYLNSYVAPPLVAGLMEQGMTDGAAMAFMMSGAVTSIPAMAAVWALVRKPVFASYVAFGMGGAFLIGIAWQLVA